MTDLFYPPETEEPATEAEARDGLSTWDELRQVADELELKLHLGGMEARDRWRTIEPRLRELEQQITRSGKRVTKSILQELGALRTALQRLREDIANGN